MASSLRIVYVSWEYPPLFGGGIGTYVHAITRVLAARGHRITVITVGRDFAPQREILDGVTVLRLPVLCAGTGPAADLRSWQLRSQAVADALRALCRTGVDLIEFADYRGEGVQFLKQTEPGSRPVCVVRLHAPLCVLAGFSPGQARNPALEEFELEAIRLADRIVSPSRVLAEHVLRHLAPVERSIDNNPYPADPVFLDAGAGCDPAASNEVLFVGRYQELKGAETLIRAAAAFLNECPTARLTMLGGDTDRVPGESMKQHVQRLVPREHADRIQLLDRMPREKLIERYAAARLCVFPSHFENFPNTCLEAMSVGRPVIGTCQTGMQEIIEDGVSGFLVPPRNVEALTEVLMRAFRLPAEELRQIGAAARSRMMTAFHPDVIAGQIEQLYGGYLAGRSSAKSTSAAETTAAVAIVIPCFNHGQFVGEAVAAARAQTHAPLEIVVVDDGSTEPATLERLDELRKDGVRVLRQENAGLASARNAGIRATTAPFFLPLDADDRIEADFVAALLPSLLADATLGYAYANVRTFGDAESAWDCPDYDPKKLLVENLSVSTAVIRRAAFEQVGGYSADMVHGYEDWD
ncbi:MAG: glycosyltransferase, partial [Planctomycetes bacterium]|nr:glycosyltransferase [Planctomycetota bacterium]